MVPEHQFFRLKLLPEKTTAQTAPSLRYPFTESPGPGFGTPRIPEEAMLDDAQMRRDFDAYRGFRRRTDIEDRRKEWFRDRVDFGGWAYITEHAGGSLFRKSDPKDFILPVPPRSKHSRALGSDDLDAALAAKYSRGGANIDPAQRQQVRDNIDRHSSAGSGSQKLGTVDMQP
jgi:hypothetical protein